MRALVASLLLAACAAAPSGTPDAGSPDASTPPTCPPGTHVSEANTCEGALTSWEAGPELAQRRDHHATFAITVPGGTFLYALGGVVDLASQLRSVERAPIAEDGTLGAFGPQGDLPEGMAGHAIAVVDRTVVVMGGYRSRGLSNRTEFARIADDGTLGEWAEGPSLSVTRFHHAAAAHGNFVYVVGGMTGNNTDNTVSVERARVDAQGLGAWESMTPLPGKRSHMAVLVHDGALYAIAGLTGNPSGVNKPLTDVLRAALGADGSVGEWQKVSDLPAALASHAAFEHAGYLYVAGGIEGDAFTGAPTDHVRRAPFLADGGLGAWEDAPALPAVRSHCHHVPVVGNEVFQVGGAVGHISKSTVFVGHLE